MSFQSQSWNFDDSGNWNSVTTDGEVQTRTHNASDQTAAIDGEALTTSLRGNLTQYTDPTGFHAGKEIELTFCRHGNRLEEARVDGERIEYKYDAFDSRPARPRFTLGAPPRLRAHHCSSYGFASAHPTASVDRRESHANPSLSENEIHYYHRQAGVRLSGASEPQPRQAKKTPARQSSHDHVYAVSDEDGNILEQYRYSAFGQVEVYSPTAQYLGDSFTNSAIGNTIGWNTKREDAVTGLLMYKYRDYSVSLGRWTQRDPIQEQGGVNLYAFVRNNSLNAWDLLGNVEMSDKSVDFIISCEINGCEMPIELDYYNKRLKMPSWPGLESGVKIGIGYDIGYHSKDELRKNWGDILTKEEIACLIPLVGLKGEEANKALKSASKIVKDIRIDYEDSKKVYKNYTLPKFVDLTKRLYKTDHLNGDQFGAMVSLTFNRGTPANNARKREMWNIKTILKSGSIARIPEQFRSMKRIWPKNRSLRFRRDQEAKLFEGSL